MIKRPRQIDYFRTVTRINVWEEFNSFDNEGQTSNGQSLNNAQVAILNSDKNDKEGMALAKKQEIPIIAAANIKIQNNNNQQTADDLYKKRRIHTSNYIRIRQDQIWPLQDKYELADDDIIFLKDFNESNNFNMKEEELEFLIENFELKSGKDFMINWIDMKDYISNELRDKYTFSNLEKIYNYWKGKRDLLKRPLLRLHWKPNFNDKDPHVAFRPRVAEKMKLRGSRKQNDDEQYQKLTQLKEEMIKYKMLVQQIKLREQMKEIILESQSLSFVSELYKQDKQLQYFFVDDVFENYKDLEIKKQKTDEKMNQLHLQNSQLNEQLTAFNLFPVVHKNSDFIIKKGLLKPTISSMNKEPKQNFEFQKSSEANSNGNNNNNTSSISTSNSVNLQNAILKGELKKTKASNRQPEETQVTAEVELKKQKNTKKSQKDGEQVEQPISTPIITSQKDPTQNKGNNNTQSVSQTSVTLPLIPPLTNQKENVQKGKQISKKGDKNGEDSAQKQNNKLNPQESSSQNPDQQQQKQSIQEREQESQKTENKEPHISLNPNLQLFNTDNFEFVSYITSIYLDAVKRELTMEKVCNLDTKNIDREQFSHILNSKTELAQQLKKLHKPSTVVQSQSENSKQQIQEFYKNPQQVNPPYLHPHYDQNQLRNIPPEKMPYLQRQQEMQYQNQNSQVNQEVPHSKRKNVIPFKPRLRLGRSGLINIDRQFDDKDNLRYEDICSKEANYHPNKVVDKLLAEKRQKENAEQQKLKVYSYTPSDQDIYKKDFFQERQRKLKLLAEDDETQFLYPTTSNQGNGATSSQQGSNQGFSQQQLNSSTQQAVSTINQESSQMQIEDNLNSTVSSSLQQQQQLNYDQDIKLLRKSISLALKNYQKQKQLNQIK
ncbi:hypothetical protein TTHERM_00049000 (macronuclear) [Tetrahymena thermophila SB210]|uniref:Enhancer of polycomb-like protein n=1 Tax=Tetrahymena thermophila (strain SB210) TaxID=312017 RepID=Q23D91_TETTS|nr:hypothetical protein TTHERM_00049000 [Tetrahymena thermophila SB210]EAR94648.2 hypothetical protein TTHERM_00049000 [Tetrahymena thermophila SB210]|eukprot:XP_001014795.2 hypothetical protein TTHERM_00049000 [Tetrahymena thermophila SB210]